MARITISDELWEEFRALARRKKRSVATYLGLLAQKEIRRDARVQERRRARFAEEPSPVASEDAEAWIPPWEI